ncbi:amino acid adenylation domain-containing protein [Roseivirga sp. BDSF3-8]|uniref:non-ribosomal peptide synthetase n=1 Tax=Roseivirga sp. BDSF3-8 TaxID=3241598 RepID=UPI003532181B
MKSTDRLELTGHAFREFLLFWKSKRADYREGINFLPVNDTPRGTFQTVEHAVSDQASQAINELTGQRGPVVWVSGVAAISCLLQRIGLAGEHLIAHAPLYGVSEEAEVRRTLYTPLLLEVKEEKEGTPLLVKDHLVSIQQQIKAGVPYQNYPVEVLEAPGGSPVFPTGLLLSSNIVHHYELPEDDAYPLHIRILLQDGRLNIQYRFEEACLGYEEIAIFHKRLEQVWGFMNNKQALLENAPVLLEEEYASLEQGLLTEEKNYAESVNILTMPGLFAGQVSRTPEAPALRYGSTTLTYRQLDRLAHRLAAELVAVYDIGPDKEVALLMDRRDWTVTSILAVWKTGASYLPLDPGYPAERIHQIMTEAKPAMCISQSDYLDRLSGIETGLFAYDIQADMLEDRQDYAFDSHARPADVAYTIYTSGSTGKPKGVEVSHAAICNTLLWRKEAYRMGEDTTCLQMFSYAFDGSLTDSFTALIAGGCLAVPEEDKRERPEAMKVFLTEAGITHFITIPSYYTALLDAWEGAMEGLKAVTLAGEPTRNELVEKHYRKLPQVKLINEYGPTENAVASTWSELHSGQPVSIGRPVTNVQAYVVDDKLRLTATGADGQLALAGPQLARGYRNMPELTSRKFIPHPLGRGERLYLTGDRARLMADGNLYLEGRIDEQVKIRGYLVELYEVEKALMALDGVAHAVAAARKDATDKLVLCAWVVGTTPLDTDGLKNALTLPAYMVPAHILQTDSLPAGASGKVDKKKLPDPFAGTSVAAVFEPPQSENEIALAEAFQQVLQAENIGLNSNFFDMGGDSIKAVQISAEMYKKGFLLDVKDMFNHGRLRELAALATKSTAEKDESLSGHRIEQDHEDMETVKAMFGR